MLKVFRATGLILGDCIWNRGTICVRLYGDILNKTSGVRMPVGSGVKC